MHSLLLAGALALHGSFTAPILPALAKRAPSPIVMLDTDNDSTVDLNEANKAGETLFAKLEKDYDGTIDAKELKGRLSKKEFKVAVPDNDGTLTKDQFLSAVSDPMGKWIATSALAEWVGCGKVS